MRKTILLLLFFILAHMGLMAQGKSDSGKVYKNTIRYNLSNAILFGGKSIVFGYERMLNNRRSFSINVGQASLPRFNIINTDSLRANSNVEEKGYNISGDYRFYLSKENKYDAPRGVYIGPYYSYNYFERTNSWLLTSTSGGSPQTVQSKTSLSVHTIGFQMGYQFILWKRFSLDMVLAGPGVGFYDLEASIGANLSEADKQKFFEKLNQALADKFPGYTTVIDDGEFARKGSASTTTIGYRYMVLVGFRF